MIRTMQNLVATALAIILLPGGAVGQTKGAKATDDQKLKAEIDKLRADLEAAQRDIRDLKAALASKVPERSDEGPLYQGRSAAQWLEKYKDTDPNYRQEAVTALGFLVRRKKDLASVLVMVMNDDDSSEVRLRAESALAGLGDEIVPKMIALLKEEKGPITGRQGATAVLARLGPKSKDALPQLIEGLKHKDLELRQRSVRALKNFGPDARAVLPILADFFEVSFVEAKAAIAVEKPSSPNEGKQLAGPSMPWRLVDAILGIDPDPKGLVQNHMTEISRKGLADAKLVPIFEEIQAALRLRYPRNKK